MGSRVLDPRSLVGVEGSSGLPPPPTAAVTTAAIVTAVIPATPVSASSGESVAVRPAGSAAVPAASVALLIMSVILPGAAAAVPPPPPAVSASAAVASFAVVSGPVSPSHLRPLPAPFGCPVVFPGTGGWAARRHCRHDIRCRRPARFCCCLSSRFSSCTWAASPPDSPSCWPPSPSG